MADNKTVVSPKPKKARERSPNYPAIALTDAIRLATTLWDKEKRTVVSAELAAKAFGYGGLSGPARTSLASLKQYGLLDNDGHGVRLSELAMQIIHQPKDSEERANAIRKAALNPPLIRELALTHSEASDDALKALLITQRRFSEDGAGRFTRAFRDAIALANLGASGYNHDDMPPEPGNVTTIGAAQTLPQGAGRSRVTILFNGPLAKGISAEVRIFGDDLLPAHIERLRQHLALAKDAVGGDPEDQRGKN